MNYELEIIKELNYQEFIKKKFIKNSIVQKKILNLYDIYPDFKWEDYKEYNPYLYIIGLRDENEYIHDYLTIGRYNGRIYKNEQKKEYSFHVLLATIGKPSIFNILKGLGSQLNEIDYLTIVYDGKNNTNNIDNVKEYTKDFKCNVIIIVEEENLGYWGHGIRNKHNDLKGDFIYHVDDDDVLFDDSFNHIRKYCKDINMIYIFKIMLENDKLIWKKKDLIYSEISTQSGIIPSHINKNGYWELKYGGDFDFYVNLALKYNILFIDKLIYKKNRKNKQNYLKK
jgi:hypothetical protein